jgi:2-polyprenyl-3-methyl-5-hydroxy-6-metoxy-1,4-benzoquinol methylase
MVTKTGYWTKDTNVLEHAHSVVLADWIADFLKEEKNTQIYDFGCGLGKYLKKLEKKGFKKLKGIEADPIKADHNFEILRLDLATPIQLEEKGIIICLEVGEHIPVEYESIFLDNLKNNCDKYLILSWAIRGQGGHGHFNELDNYEVVGKISNLGFTFLKDLTLDVRSFLEVNEISRSCHYFKNTLLFFEKK